MNTKITLDLKSLALGSVATALVFFGVAATTGPTSSPTTMSRYQVSVGSEGKAVILDTVSGQSWTTKIQDDGTAILAPNGHSAFIMPKNV